jgi:putative transposase
MARLPRYLLDGLFHHVTARATGDVLLYQDDEDRRYFRELLKTTIPLFDWTCWAWCLMGTHFHLLVEAPLDKLSGGMHRVDSRYARWFNDRHGRRGRVFADRFSSFLIRDEPHLYAACHYVLENPVRARLARTCEEWPWSGLGAPT